MTQVIINADDFGLSKGVNYGIIEAHRNGLLTSTTLMVTMPYAEHAVSLLDCAPHLGLGLHFNVSLGKPLTKAKSLVDEAGEFIKPQFLKEDVYQEADVYEELKAQYHRFLKLTGRKPSHIDTHLFSSDRIPSVQKAVIRFASEHYLPVRNLETKHFDAVEFISFRKYDEKAGLDYLFKHYRDFKNYEVIEIMSHPAYLDEYVMDISSYTTERLRELQILCSKKLKLIFEEEHFELITYNQITK